MLRIWNYISGLDHNNAVALSKFLDNILNFDIQKLGTIPDTTWILVLLYSFTTISEPVHQGGFVCLTPWQCELASQSGRTDASQNSMQELVFHIWLHKMLQTSVN